MRRLEHTRHHPFAFRTMHLTLILIVVVSYSTAYSHPLASEQPPHELPRQPNSDGLNSSTSRPLQQFFIKILSAFRAKPQPLRTTRAPPAATTTQRTSVPFYQQPIEVQQIPNFVDFSSYLLTSFANNNSAIKFSYVQPNTTALRSGNYSVISFLVPHDSMEGKGTRGVIANFLNLFRAAENRPPPSDTVYSQFPPLFEYFTQRIQAYFSVYKFPDDSRMNNTIVLELDDAATHSDEEMIEETTDDAMTTTDANESALTTTEVVDEMEL